MVRALIPSLPSDAVRALNLSGMHTLAPSIIVDILTTYPKLMRLTLLDTNITEEQIKDLLYNQPELFFNIHDLIHPALLTRAPPVSAKISVDDPEGLRAVYQRFSSGPQGFTIIQSGTPDMLFDLQPTITSIPYFRPEKVLRGLATCLRPLEVGFDSSLRAKKYLASQLGPLMALSIATPLVPQPVIPSTFPSDSEDRLRWLHRSISTVPIKGSYDDFRAHGWLFVLKYTPGSFFSPIPHATYGFIKVDEKVHAPVLQELMEDAWKAWKAHKDSKAEGGTEAAKPNDNALPVLPVDLATLIKVYDVRGFADAVEKEGRPRPSEEAIAALEEVLDDEFVVEGLPPSKVFTQMGLEEAKTFIPIASQRIRFT
ncbi:hypothetical protein VNI00_014277 [Paramarasmius palmivorus]|uniref:Uncharacterized protein n=1 Tax=Paramarasmius palmivorus TaxID=297713 RepID=A0AAW0BVK4_9AGAR